MSGIYAIEHTATGKLYVGSAVYITGRFCAHQTCLRRNKHGNAKLQAAWNKYGEDAFEFVVIEAVPDKAQLLVREQFWIDGLSPHFNIQREARSAFGLKRTEETKARVAAAKRGLKASDETKAAMAAAQLGRVMLEETKLKIAQGRTGWRHTDEAKAILSEKMAKIMSERGFKPTPEQIAASVTARAKTFSFVSPEGEAVTFTNLNLFCRENGLQQASMCHVLSGRRNSHKGWTRYPG